MYLKARESSTHPDLREEMAEAASQFVIDGVTHPVGIEQVEVLKQRTYVVDPGQVPAEDERSAITSCFARIYGLPPKELVALILMLAAQKSPDSEFLPSCHKLGVFPNPPHAPFYEFNLIDPLLGMTPSAMVNDPGIRSLRAVLPDGTVYEDSVSNNSLLVLVPIFAPGRWTFDEAPTFHLLNQDGDDIIAPGRFPLDR